MAKFTARIGAGFYLGFMQPLRKEEAFIAIEEQAANDAIEGSDTQSSFNTFAGLVLGTALGLYSWAALLILLRWIL